MNQRRRARQLAMQALYQLDIQGDDVLGDLLRFFKVNTTDSLVRRLAMEWTQGTWSKVAECDKLITQYSLRWRLYRIALVDKAILRLSVYHLLYDKNMPAGAVINEAIELAKKYSSAQSAGFINGILDAISKNRDNPLQAKNETENKT